MADNMGGGPLVGRPQGIKSESVGPMALPSNKDPNALLSTYIYDYFLKTRHPELAEMLLSAKDLGVKTKPRTKTSPGGRDVNGLNDGSDSGPKDDIARRIDEMPVPDLGGEQLSNHSFLQDWFTTFWDVWNASKNMANTSAGNAAQYLNNAHRNRNAPMLPNGTLNNRFMMRSGVHPNLQKQAMNNMQQQLRLGGQFPGNQLGPSGSDNQRPQSPNGDNAPSPKRPRVEGNTFTPGMGGNPNMPGQLPNGQGPNMPPGAMDSGLTGMMGAHMQGFMPGADGTDKQMPNNPQGGALADYQMQLMLLEQQNKRRLLMARQEQDAVSGQNGTGIPGTTQPPTVMGAQNPFGGPPGAVMSPHRTAQSPSPHNPPKHNASQIGQSPQPEIGVSRGSPFNPQNSQIPNGQMFQNQMKQMGPNAMMPGGPAGFPGPNGQMKNPMAGNMQRQPNMQQAQFNPGMAGPFGHNPQQQAQQAQQQAPNGNLAQANHQGNQQPNSMPPPSAPAAGNATGRANPASPAPSPAPSTPSGKNTTTNRKKDAATKKEAPSKAKAQQPKKPGTTPSAEQTPPPPTPTQANPPPNELSGNQQQPRHNVPQPTPNGVPSHPTGQPQPDMNTGPVPDSSTDHTNMSGNLDMDMDLGFGNSDEILGGFDFESFLQPESISGFDGFDSSFLGADNPMEMGAGDNQ